MATMSGKGGRMYGMMKDNGMGGAVTMSKLGMIMTDKMGNPMDMMAKPMAMKMSKVGSVKGKTK